MRWKSLFTAPPMMSTCEVREYFEKDSPSAYQLVDVREVGEYRTAHLPGAIFIPLSELENRFQELDPSKKTIVYCRSGARSKTACQFLEERGFTNIYNMAGGILAWQGATANGTEENGLEYFLGKDYTSVYELSCNLEAGLRYFYQEMAKFHRTQESNAAFVQLLDKMASFEDEHIERLTTMHRASYPDQELKIDPTFIEGGGSALNMVAVFAPEIDTPQSLLQLCISFEAQALDLYSRLQKRVDNADQKEFFATMAAEERQHLALLAAEVAQLEL